jgi:hypothetical protein
LLLSFQLLGSGATAPTAFSAAPRRPAIDCRIPRLGQDRDVTRKQDHSRAYARSFLAGFLEHGTPWQPWQPSAPEWSSRRRRSDRLFVVCARCDAASILSRPEVGVELVLPLRAKQKKTTRMTRASSSLAKRSPHGGARRITPSHRGTSNMALSILQENTAHRS